MKKPLLFLLCFTFILLTGLAVLRNWFVPSLLFAVLAYISFHRILQNDGASRLLEETKRKVADEDATKAARKAVIDLHLHAPDRAYYLTSIDKAASQKELLLIVEEAKIVANKHPLGMNL